MRPLIAALFTLAVSATILAGDGLVLVPHSHVPGMPADHPHGLALYRFPIALLGEPADAPRVSAPTDNTMSFRLAAPASETFAGASLLLVAALLIVFARPRVRAIALWRERPALAAQWSATAPTGPPRLSIA